MFSVPANLPARYVPLIEVLQQILVRADYVSERWDVSPQTLSNWRTQGKGLPSITLPEGAVRYRLSEVIAAELAGTKGPLTVQRVVTELALMPEVPPDLAKKIAARLRETMGCGT